MSGSGLGGFATTEEYLRNISKYVGDNWSRMNKEQRAFFGQVTGIGPEMLRAMRNGPEEFDKTMQRYSYIAGKLNDERTVKSTEETDAAKAEFLAQWDLFKQNLFGDSGISKALYNMGSGLLSSVNSVDWDSLGAWGIINAVSNLAGSGLQMITGSVGGLLEGIINPIAHVMGFDGINYKDAADSADQLARSDYASGNYLSGWGMQLLGIINRMFTYDSVFANMMKEEYEAYDKEGQTIPASINAPGSVQTNNRYGDRVTQNITVQSDAKSVAALEKDIESKGSYKRLLVADNKDPGGF